MIDVNPAGIEWLAPPPSEPLAVAREFLTSCMSDGDVLLLRSHRGSFFAYSGTCWPEHEERALRAPLYVARTRDLRALDGAGIELVPWAPTKAKIGNVLDALHAATHLAASITPPAWLDETDPDAAGRSFPGQRPPERPHAGAPPPYACVLLAALAAVPLRSRRAPPDRWNLVPARAVGRRRGVDRRRCRRSFGYILAGETEQQKLFLLVGPKRSGKGTIGRVLTGLLGAHNTAAPTLSGLTTNFGLSPLIGKPLAIISDARLSSRPDSMIAVERLLSISGEDTPHRRPQVPRALDRPPADAGS